jgi:outer membrane protein OmpA-like peptidoglycan-associated protein
MMNNKKIFPHQWAILPLLFCSTAVLAGDGGLDAPYGQIPSPPAHSSLTLEDDAVPAPMPVPMPPAATPDTMSQAQDLGQQADGFLEDSSETSSVNTGYVGGNTRLGIGVDTELKGKADVSHVIRQNEGSATIGQGYVGFNPTADKALGEESLTGAGAKLSHHWVSGDPNTATRVNKVFGAYDQNEQKDKKATVGYGQESENLFWSGHVSKGLSEARTVAPGINEKAYDLGVGGRVGTYLPNQQMRVQGGLDHEWGTDFAGSETRPTQTTVTGGVEKFFPDTPHSVGAEVEVYKKAGGAVVAGSSDNVEARGGVSYRYDIGSEAGVWQPEQRYRRIRTEIPGEQIKQPPKIERKLVKNTMELESDTFFKLDRAELTPEAQERMKAVIGQIRASGHDGNIRITGNTCDKGSDAHNMKLSDRRANAVRDFMIKNGFSGNELLAQGLGESQPKYPNTNAEGHKNRRVDIEYVTYQNEYKDEVIQQGGTSTTDPKVVWRKELIPEPPLWVRQALHNVADHKQSVDTYKTTAGTGAPVSPNAPVAVNDNATTTSGTPVSIAVLANDTDPNGDVLSIVSFNQGTNGSVTQVGSTLVYTPVLGFTGTDTFTYVIKDPAGNQSTATVTVKVGAADPNAPVAGNDTATTLSGTPVTIDVLTNDRDPNGDTLTILSFNQGANGGVTQVGNALVYTPVAGFTGTDTFTYVIRDPAGNKSTATVTITVNPATPNAPLLENDTARTAVGAPVRIAVLSNDRDPNDDALSIAGFSPSTNGTVTQDGSELVYTPRAGFTGTDTFTYIATDPAGNRTTATVTITVVGAGTSPNAPVAGADQVETVQDTPVTIKVLDNDSDVDGDTLSVTSVGTDAAHGRVTLSGNNVIYTPNAGFSGEDQFTYTVADGTGNSTVGRVFVKINTPGGNLKASSDLYTVDMNSSTNSFAVMSNDEVPTTGATITIVSNPSNGGTASVSGSNVLYTPKTGYSGLDKLTYRLTDSRGYTTDAVVDITISDTSTPSNLAPKNDYLLIDLNDTVTRKLPVLSNDVGDSLEIVAVSTPHYGTAVISADGQSINYTLRSGYCADHSFTYIVKDKAGNQKQATVYIDVAPANMTDPNVPPA